MKSVWCVPRKLSTESTSDLRFYDGMETKVLHSMIKVEMGCNHAYKKKT